MKNWAGRLVLVLLLIEGAAYADEATAPIIEKVSKQVQQSFLTNRSFGFNQEVYTNKMDEHGVVVKTEKRTFRTIWINDQPYNELIQTGDKDLNAKEKAAEAKRRAEFVKALYTGRKENGFQQELKKIEWWTLHKRYHFTLLPPEPGSPYVLSFRPKDIELPEKCRFDRVLNRLTGTIWIDEGFNVRKAEARLTTPVRFGFGILAKVDEVLVSYLQQRHGEAWLPASLRVLYRANIALFRHQRQELQVHWNDPYPRSENIEIATSLTK